MLYRYIFSKIVSGMNERLLLAAANKAYSSGFKWVGWGGAEETASREKIVATGAPSESLRVCLSRPRATRRLLLPSGVSSFVSNKRAALTCFVSSL